MCCVTSGTGQPEAWSWVLENYFGRSWGLLVSHTRCLGLHNVKHLLAAHLISWHFPTTQKYGVEPKFQVFLVLTVVCACLLLLVKQARKQFSPEVQQWVANNKPCILSFLLDLLFPYCLSQYSSFLKLYSRLLFIRLHYCQLLTCFTLAVPWTVKRGLQLRIYVSWDTTENFLQRQALVSLFPSSISSFFLSFSFSLSLIFLLLYIWYSLMKPAFSFLTRNPVLWSLFLTQFGIFMSLIYKWFFSLLTT